MQLQMTAPLDIGLEQTDAVLGHGQEDMFDLQYAERVPRNKGLPDTDDDDVEEPEESKDDNSSDGEALDTDGEQNSRLKALENDLDGLYETYRERLAERDAKYRVREARQHDKRREEWSGIDKGEAESDTGDEDGGWDEMEQRRARSNGSDSSSTDEDEPSSSQLSKRQRPRQPEGSRKKARLLTSLEEPQTALQMSRKTDVWFSQDVFNGLGDLSEDDDDDEANSSQPSQDVEV